MGRLPGPEDVQRVACFTVSGLRNSYYSFNRSPFPLPGIKAHRAAGQRLTAPTGTRFCRARA